MSSSSLSYKSFTLTFGNIGVFPAGYFELPAGQTTGFIKFWGYSSKKLLEAWKSKGGGNSGMLSAKPGDPILPFNYTADLAGIAPDPASPAGVLSLAVDPNCISYLDVESEIQMAGEHLHHSQANLLVHTYSEESNPLVLDQQLWHSAMDQGALDSHIEYDLRTHANPYDQQSWQIDVNLKDVSSTQLSGSLGGKTTLTHVVPKQIIDPIVHSLDGVSLGDRGEPTTLRPFLVAPSDDFVLEIHAYAEIDGMIIHDAYDYAIFAHDRNGGSDLLHTYFVPGGNGINTMNTYQVVIHQQ